MEPRALTRIDVHKFARRAYELGVRYIGGCCGFEPYHIRAIAEEVSWILGRRNTIIRFFGFCSSLYFSLLNMGVK